MNTEKIIKTENSIPLNFAKLEDGTCTELTIEEHDWIRHINKKFREFTDEVVSGEGLIRTAFSGKYEHEDDKFVFHINNCRITRREVEAKERQSLTKKNE